MLERILITGSGGQGVVLIGRLLAGVAVEELPHVTFFPAYGAEVRGGVSRCEVVLSTEEIASPVPENFDSAILMNPLNTVNPWGEAPPPGLILVNTTEPSRAADGAIPVAAVEIARQASGQTRSANFVMLGAWLARKPLLSIGAMEKNIRQWMTGKEASVLEMNLKSFRAGLKI